MPVETPTGNPARTTPPARWAYGVTTVQGRLKTLLPPTLASLKAGGFGAPILFADGVGHREAAALEEALGLDVVARPRLLRPFGNWALALLELHLRNPHAERYALFQDDLLMCRNTADYLDACAMPADGYLNIYTWPANQSLFPLEGQSGRQRLGWLESNQRGLGALALVFSRAAVLALIGSAHMALRPQDPQQGFRKIDGGVVEALKKAGFREWVHNPSLVQHVGYESSMDKRREPGAAGEPFPSQRWGAASQALSFPGEGFDALTLVGQR